MMNRNDILRRILFVIPSFTLGLFPRSGWPGCLSHNSTLSRFQDVVDASNIHRVAVIDSPDRKTAADYAAAHGVPENVIERRFAATGDFSCGDLGQANLTAASDVIATAAHSVFPKLDCSKRADLSKCKFVIKTPNGIQTFHVSEIIGTGVKCPGQNILENDWIVLRLSEEVKGVEPFQVNRQSSIDLTENQTVVAVGKSADFRPKKMGSERDMLNYPKHIGDCSIRTVWRRGEPDLLATDCDGAHMNSGGGLLIGNVDRPILIGVNQGRIPETSEQAIRAGRTGRLNSGQFDPTTWSNVYIPVSGEFLKTLQKIQKHRAGTDI